MLYSRRQPPPEPTPKDNEEEDEIEYTYIPPVSKKWESLGSEQEVDEETVRTTRPLVRHSGLLLHLNMPDVM